MKKADWQYLVDTLLFICIVGIALIGILLAFFIPKGPSALESSKYFLNLHRHQWGNIHLYLSLTFIFLVIIHLTLDWKWIKARANQIFKKGWKTALISTVLISIFVIFLLWLFYPKEPGAHEEYGIKKGTRGQESSQKELAADAQLPPQQHKVQPTHGRMEEEQKITRGKMDEDQSGILITGQISLYEIEKRTGVPAQKIIEKLGLPQNVSRQENIGRLRRRYRFTLQDVRDIVASLMKK